MPLPQGATSKQLAEAPKVIRSAKGAAGVPGSNYDYLGAAAAEAE